MRIIGGDLRGRKIIAPKGVISRPTTDRVRESLFNILHNRDDLRLEDARVIDLFAGSGALGFESLSRGARHCLFVEQNNQARAAIRNNIEALNLFGQTRLHRRSATALGALPASAGGRFSIAFLDPPYEKGLVAPALQSLHEGGWLENNAHAIIEQSAHEHSIEANFFEQLDHRIYGDTQIGVYQYRPR